MAGCVFCKIAEANAPATVVQEWRDALAIEPLDPVVPGHILVIPKVHVDNAGEDPFLTGIVMMRAAELAGDQYQQYNIITSTGAAATQTVFHLHIHIVPRYARDGLHLPWTGQHR